MGKYEEALERARQGKPMAEVFPELRESKDEETRKDIIKYLRLVGKGDGDYAQPMIDRWISYLEKQKEQKPTNSEKPKEWNEEDEMMFTSVVDTLALTNGAAQMKINWLKRLKDKVLIQSKSAGWSEEDVKMIGIAIAFIEQFTSCRYVLGVDKLDVIAWLKALRSGILYGNSHRKPTEEQINALKEIDVNS